VATDPVKNKQEYSTGSYHPGDWGYKPSEDMRITIRLVPIAIVILLIFTFGLAATRSQKGNATQLFDERGGQYKDQLEEAYTLVVNGDYDSASQVASGVLRNDPQNPLAHTIQGLSHARRGLTEEAAISFETAVTLDPEFELAWFNLGVVEESRGEFERALEAYEKAYDLDPSRTLYRTSTERLTELIHGEDRGEWRETEAERLFLNGVSAVNRGGTEDLVYAEGIFRSLLENRPYDVASRNMLGKTLARQGRVDEAETEFLQVVSEEPGFSEAWYNLGMLYRSQGRLEDAIRNLEIAYDTSTVESFRDNTLVQLDEIRSSLESEELIRTDGSVSMNSRTEETGQDNLNVSDE